MINGNRKVIPGSINYGHDASLTYLYDNQIRYIKWERLFQVKHFGPPNKTIKDKDTWKDFINLYILQKHSGKFFYTNILQDRHHLKHALSVDIMEKHPIDVHFVIDGVGDNQDAWCSVYRNYKLIDRKLSSIVGRSIGTSIGLYLARALDIKGHGLDLAGKFMGLQSYGKIDLAHYDYICKNYHMDYFGTSIKNYKKEGNPWTFISNEHFWHLDQSLSYDEKINRAHTLHFRVGELLLDYFSQYANPQDRIGYSGGMAQNVVWNTLLKKKFPNLIIYPHCGDEGLSLGSIEMYRAENKLSKFDMSRYPFMQEDEAPNTEPTLDTIYKTAKLLSEGKIVAWYQGQGEVGPRALGHRSILMDPRIPNGKDIINQVKNRESYRPFGASILSEYAKEYFDLDFENPYMLYLGTTQKSNLQSITHVDGTCRAQTVSPNTGVFRTLLEQFFEITGCPVLLNTSLNEAGKPIAGKIQNAMNEFTSKPIDVLVVGNDILIK